MQQRMGPMTWEVEQRYASHKLLKLVFNVSADVLIAEVLASKLNTNAML